MTREVYIDERLLLLVVTLEAILDKITKHFGEGLFVGILIRLDLFSCKIDMLKSFPDDFKVGDCRRDVRKGFLIFLISERAVVSAPNTNSNLSGSLEVVTTCSQTWVNSC